MLHDFDACLRLILERVLDSGAETSMQAVDRQEFHQGLVKKYLFFTALTRERGGNNAILFKRPIEVAVGMTELIVFVNPWREHMGILFVVKHMMSWLLKMRAGRPEEWQDLDNAFNKYKDKWIAMVKKCMDAIMYHKMRFRLEEAARVNQNKSIDAKLWTNYEILVDSLRGLLNITVSTELER